MTTIQVYRNRRNSNKYIEVHNDGHYHNSLKQYLYWERNVITGEPLPEPVKNITGDRRLHRWRKANLKELLDKGHRGNDLTAEATDQRREA